MLEEDRAIIRSAASWRRLRTRMGEDHRGRAFFRSASICLLAGLCLAIVIPLVDAQIVEAQTQPGPPAPVPAAGGTIHGVVKSGSMPIPGAAISISSAASSDKISTWTDVDGSYSASVPGYGSYTVRVGMMAFAEGKQDAVLDASHTDAAVNFELTLLSR